MHEIDSRRVYEFDLSGQFSFGNLSESSLKEVYRDGRVASHLLEVQLEHWFPELKHVKGCKGHDHVSRHNEDVLYDAKSFTRGGCKFMPSNMLGTGRSFDAGSFAEKTSNMQYIICDIVDFPRVRVVFREGRELASEYPTGVISPNKRCEIFTDNKGGA